MIKLKGNPGVKIGISSKECSGPDTDVPAICDQCRQVDRWLERILTWFKNDGESRFKSIARAILQEHDDILKSFCGFCFIQDEDKQSCECFVSKYRSLGLPMRIPVLVGYDECLRVGTKIVYEKCDVASCWFEECGQQVCETCEFRDLDPCNNPEDLALMQALYEVQLVKISKPNSYINLINAIKSIYQGSSPQVITYGGGLIRLWIGRQMTDSEIQMREWIKQFLPLNSMVEIAFVEPCE